MLATQGVNRGYWSYFGFINWTDLCRGLINFFCAVLDFDDIDVYSGPRHDDNSWGLLSLCLIQTPIEGDNGVDVHTRQLVMEVMDGNPGALLIIRRLMYFAPWHLLLHHLKAQGLTGSRLWQVVKDDYAYVWTQFAHDQLVNMQQIESGATETAGLPVVYRYN